MIHGGAVHVIINSMAQFVASTFLIIDAKLARKEIKGTTN